MTVSCLWGNVGRWVSEACLMTVSCSGANVEPSVARGGQQAALLHVNKARAGSLRCCPRLSADGAWTRAGVEEDLQHRKDAPRNPRSRRRRGGRSGRRSAGRARGDAWEGTRGEGEQTVLVRAAAPLGRRWGLQPGPGNRRGQRSGAPPGAGLTSGPKKVAETGQSPALRCARAPAARAGVHACEAVLRRGGESRRRRRCKVGNLGVTSPTFLPRVELGAHGARDAPRIVCSAGAVFLHPFQGLSKQLVTPRGRGSGKACSSRAHWNPSLDPELSQPFALTLKLGRISHPFPRTLGAAKGAASLAL
ncbi:hypothetical protein NN561_011693 [Cricetulus griseus]